MNESKCPSITLVWLDCGAHDKMTEEIYDRRCNQSISGVNADEPLICALSFLEARLVENWGEEFCNP